MTTDHAARLHAMALGYTAAWCSQNPDSVAAYYAPDGSLAINGGTPAVGRAAIAQSARDFMTAFPDMVVSMDDLLDLGDRVIYRWTLAGTNSGPGGTGRRVRIRGFEDWTLSPELLVVRSLGHYDAADYARQLEHGVTSETDAARAIAAVNAALDRALVSGTPDEAAAHFAVDALLGESGMADVVGRAAITAFLARGNQVRRVTHHLVEREDLILLGDRAIEFARFDETKVLAAGGAVVRERGRFVTDWRREADGAWRIARMVISDVPLG